MNGAKGIDAGKQVRWMVHDTYEAPNGWICDQMPCGPTVDLRSCAALMTCDLSRLIGRIDCFEFGYGS